MRALVETVRIDGHPVRLRTLAPAGRVRDALAPTIVMVHGIGMSHRSFLRVQTLLSQTHRTVSVDLPGFGGLTRAGRRFQVDEYADLVVRAVTARGISDLVVMGQSMGTQIAVAAALRHPDVVNSVVLVGPVVDDRRRSLPRLGAQLLLDCAIEGLRMNVIVFGDYVRSIPQYARELLPMRDFRMLDSVRALTVPVLLIRGEQDPIAKHDWVERLVAAADAGALVELPGPHHVQEHQPVAVARLVDEFRRVQTLEATRDGVPL
ncbi:alpha/beta hydrolase [Curtobacterium sp. MCPF17_047]|uniref:alpha/beta fold hydrolase n=1 Tax=Curtobacterium sp. MCPF17_047 TaxID=2175654 RepID=UPI000DA96BB2|nr:alpha/beta fold hydrolase [Curtobacterium sp. MCPF17_047]PZF64590.1 alpha/beta hydrolase [Curtobacterium sp. MCPF17_047]